MNRDHEMCRQKVRYGAWAGNPNGTPVDESRCRYEVGSPFGIRFHQCSRRCGHGPEGMYCKQHARKVEE